MVQLTPDECRVLGVLVEKAHTTASQYPMSLNALVTGCNQKSNRCPVVRFDEDRVVRVLESLRDKRLVTFADTLASRVMKYKHNSRETLQIGTKELVILTELMLRGPQTAGEIRSRAARMHPLGALEEVRNTLQDMMEGDEPMVRLLPTSPGSRAVQYAQLLCPDLHPIETSAPVEADADPDLAGRVERLEGQVSRLCQIVEYLARSLGETDILAQLAEESQSGPPDGLAQSAGE
ncbi:MAG TPA: YceH family protein [Phycisphaerae bacterium]|nr:YceH family protein [Phycisphaerae bacterium]